MKVFLSFFALFVSLTGYSQLKYHVSTSGNDVNSGLTPSLACATIQHAIDLSVSGDSILVQPGLYTENIIFNGKNIKVCSNYYLNQDTSFISTTIIDGDANGFPVVRFVNGENNNAQLNGFTIRNGLTATNLWGAGIHIHGWGTSPTIKNCHIKNNTVFNQSSGAGIYLINTEAVSIIQNVIIENNVNLGGIGGFSAHASNFDMKNVIIRNNSGLAFHRTIGAGSISNHIYPVTNCLIVNNNYPSAISCQDVVFLNCTIANNNGTITFAGNSGIINSIIGGGQSISTQGFLRVRNSLIQDGQTSITTPIQSLVTYVNNISGDPKFVQGSQGNYQLQNSSNCIGNGTNSVTFYSFLYNSPSNDLINVSKPTPNGSSPDIGCYENSYALSSPVLTSITGSNQSATLNWSNNNVSNVIEYRIFRSTSPIPDTVTFGSIASITTAATFTYADNNLTNLTAYYYRIQAKNSQGFWSGLSNQMSVTPNIQPTTPSILSSEIGPRRNYLKWSSSTGSNSSIQYRIFRGTQANNLTLIKDSYLDTSYIDTGLVANILYYYQIAAVDNYNVQSALSSSITLKPNRIWYISESGTNNSSRGFVSFAMGSFSYLQPFANPGDTVIYLPGQYYENINLVKSINISSLAILTPSNLVNYQNNTHLTALTSNPLITVAGTLSNKLNLYGLTIQNCSGPILNISSTVFSEISHVNFINNGNLGAQVINIYGNTLIKNCFFSGNVFSTLITMQATGTGFPTVQSCEFKNNGQSNQFGKSLMYAFTRAIIANNIIYNNIGAMINGGCNGPLDTLMIMHNSIVGNQGYGIVLDHCSGGVNGFFYNNIIENNSLGCLWFVSNAGGFSTIRLRNNKLNPNPYFTQNPTQYALTWQNNDTVSGFTFAYPITNVSQLSLPNSSTSIGSGTTYALPNLLKDFKNNNRPVPIGSNPDRGAIESNYSNASPILLSADGFNQSAQLTWNNNGVGNITEFRIFRSTNPIPDTVNSGAFISGLSSITFTFLNTNLQNQTTYYYRIQSKNSFGHWSGLSNELSVIPNFPPSTPQILISEAGPRRAYVKWSGSISANSTVKYRVFRGISSNQLSIVKNNLVDTFYVDTALVANQNYFYAIAAYDTFNVQSALSSSITLKPNRIWYISENGIDNNSNGFSSFCLSSFNLTQQLASTGDTIILKPGQYYQNFTVNKSLTLASLYILGGPIAQTFKTNTILSSANSNTLITSVSNLNVYFNLIGFTIQNCPGQVLNISSNAYSEISNMRFVNNGNLGISLINSYGNTQLNNCYFSGNQFNTLMFFSGSGIGYPSVNSSEFKNNGVANQFSKCLVWFGNKGIVTNSVFYNNIGSMISGGCNSPLDSMIIINNTIVGNQGYGLMVEHCYGGANGFFYNNIIENNTLGNLRFSGYAGYSIIRLKNNKLSTNPITVNNPSEFSISWQNNDTISGQTFSYPITNISQLSLPNYSNSIGSGITYGLSNLLKDFTGANRPIPNGSSPDRGAFEHVLGAPSNAPPLMNTPTNLSSLEDQINTINFTGIDDGDFYSSQNVNFYASSGNTSIINNISVNHVVGESTASISYTPVLNAYGIVPITIKLKDNGGILNGGVDSTLYTININVSNVNDAPVALNDTTATNEDTPVSLSLVTNDSDIDNALATNSIDLNQTLAGVQSTLTNSFGSWSVNTSGLLTFTPALNFNGVASINYTIKDVSSAVSNVAQVVINVNPINDAPIAVNNNATTNEDVAISFNVLTNDTDVDNLLDSTSIDLDLSASGLQNSLSTSSGSWSVNSSGILTFSPNLNYFGLASISYNVKDVLGLTSNNATITITVNSVNDAPDSIELSSNVLNENQISVIGDFNSFDIDQLQTFTYTLCPGLGDFDNSNFSISNGQLTNISTFNFEDGDDYSIRVRSTDQDGLSIEQIFIIQVMNVNDIQITETINNTYCNGLNANGTISITPSNTNGPINYNWTGPNNFTSTSQNISNLESGQYQLTLTDSLNTSNFNLQINQIPTYDDLSICFVTGDTMPGNHNRIYFNNTNSYNIQYYQVLRESTVQGQFDFIGQVSAIDSSFLDLISNNQAQTFNYRVRSIDSCGNMSSESSSHKTILLQANLSANNSVNLTWSPYEGVTYGSYSIYRSVNNGIFQLLVTLPSSNQSFNDVGAMVDQNDYTYFVSINVPSCDFTKNNEIVMSNVKNLSSVSLSEFETELSIHIHPNPTNDFIYINNETNLEITQSEIFDGTGKILKTFYGIETSLSTFTPGTYFIRVNFNNGRSFIRKISKM